MNWIKILKVLKYSIVVAFAFLHIIKRGQFIEDTELFKNVWLYKLPTLFITFYVIVFLSKSRLELKEKEDQIVVLNAQLNK